MLLAFIVRKIKGLYWMDRIFNHYFCKFSKRYVFWRFLDHVTAILFYLGNDNFAYVILKCLIMEYRGWEEGSLLKPLPASFLQSLFELASPSVALDEKRCTKSPWQLSVCIISSAPTSCADTTLLTSLSCLSLVQRFQLEQRIITLLKKTHKC